VTKDMEKAQHNAAFAVPSAISTQNKKSAFLSFESRLMNSFHVGDSAQNQINISKFVGFINEFLIISDYLFPTRLYKILDARAVWSSAFWNITCFGYTFVGQLHALHQKLTIW
jgi:hypothetical protein